jgi:hypothetical protein
VFFFSLKINFKDLPKSFVIFVVKSRSLQNPMNKRKIENPKKYFKFIKVKQKFQSS